VHLHAVRIDHPEVHAIQPTWHCLQRFRERQRFAPGVDTAVELLAAALHEAQITTRPPRGVRTRGDWSLWAVAGDLAFPLTPGPGPGTYTAPTCLTAARPTGPRPRSAPTG
jgi:hypothetical protein